MKVEGDRATNFLLIDGKKFVPQKVTVKKIDGRKHYDKMIFKEVNEEDYDKKMDLVVESLRENVNTGDILREALKGLEYNNFIKLYNLLKKKKVKVAVQRGCLALNFQEKGKNKFYLQLYE